MSNARVIIAFWLGTQKRRAWLFTLSLIVLTIAQVVVPVALNEWNRHLFDAVEQRDMARLVRQVGYLALIVLGNMAVLTLHLTTRRRMQIAWRDDLTGRIMEQWIRHGRQYQMSELSGNHDNPDGRIAEDIRIATEYSVDLVHSLLYCTLLLASFTQILWSLSGPPDVNLGFAQFWLPGHLVWLALIYAGLGAAAATLLGRPLVRAADFRQAREADFRFGLVRARETALTVAVQSSSPAQHDALTGLFQEVVGAWQRQTRALAHLFMFSSSWSVLTQTVPVLVSAPRYIAGTITLGSLMQAAQAFQQMITALSWPVDNMQKVAECQASIARVAQLHRSLEELKRQIVEPSTPTILLEPGIEQKIVVTDLCLQSPAGEKLFAPFSMTILPGERVIIRGDPLQAIKLFRAIAGIWPWGTGAIHLPANDGISFLPRRVRLTQSTFRDALADGPDRVVRSDSDARAALYAVGLGDWAAHLDDVDDWSIVLSGQERQRLNFARVLLHRPSWILLREATSDLPSEEAARLFACIASNLPSAAIVAIGHDAMLALPGSRVVEMPAGATVPT